MGLVNLSVESLLQPAQTNTVMDLGPAICDLAGKQILVTAALIFVNSPFPRSPLIPRHHVTCFVALTCAGCYVPVRFGIPSSFGHIQTFGGTVTIGHNERQGAFIDLSWTLPSRWHSVQRQCPEGLVLSRAMMAAVRAASSDKGCQTWAGTSTEVPKLFALPRSLSLVPLIVLI